MFLLLDCYSRNLATCFQCLRSSVLFHSPTIPPPPPTLTLTLPSLFACHSRVTSAWSQATLLLSDLQGMYMIGGSLYLEGLKESARVFIDYDM